MNRLKMLVLAFALACSLPAQAADLAKRPVSMQDLFQFNWIGDPQMAPQGATLAYVGVKVNEARSDYDTSLYLVSTAGNDARRLTMGKRDSAPRWSPDGKTLAFLRAVEKDGKFQPPQLHTLSMAGGEAQQLTRLPGGVTQPAWSPDGTTIAFLSRANEADLAKVACEEKEKSVDKCKGLRDTDVRVISRAAWRSNGAGYLDFSRPQHLWSVAVAGGAPQQLTRGEYSDQEFVWAPDGKQLYVAADHDHEPYYELLKRTIHAVPSSGGVTALVTRFEGMLNGMAVSPSGKQLAFVGTLQTAPLKSHTQSNLFLVDLDKGNKLTNMSGSDNGEVGSGISTDQSAPRGAGGSRPQWSFDGKSITVAVARNGRANLERFDVAGGKPVAITRGDQAVMGYTSNGKELVAELSTTTELNELYAIGKDGSQRRLTGANDKLFAGLAITAPQDIWYTSFDGRKIHTLVQTPPGFDPAKKYPLILNIHGGPHAAFGHTFHHEMQAMAAKGYVVLYPNPRGSTTYGEEFANVIQYKYPGDDYLDLMAGVDELVKRGYIDTKRMGVTGGSGGGLLTNWVIGKTDRFAAAVSQRDIADWTAWWYSADFLLYQPSWFRKPPFEDPEDYRKRSPITYVNNIKTPTMFILGDADSRTPSEAGGEQMFRALKYRKVPTVMVKFPNESHELSRSGNPWHRVERLQHITNWFDIYLQGKKANDYNIMPPAIPDVRAAE
jgi:dipeptidyl aminopeptidase/acylaminoacyl peptidase